MKKYMSDAMVVIDSYPQNAHKYKDDHAIICVDVIRSSTTAITAVAKGRRCFPAASLDEAIALSNAMADDRPLLVGELGGRTPNGFGIANSPSVVAKRDDVERPLILLSTTGTQLIQEASGGLVTFLACLRNITAAAEFLIGRYRKVAIIGAGTRNEFSEEDQICCAWMADILSRNGFKPATKKTSDLIKKWKGVPIEAFLGSRSVEFLRNSNQEEDLEFILSHVDDLDASFLVAENEVLMIPRVFYEQENSVASEAAW